MIEGPHATELEAGKGERMSRSEQSQDSSMDEILASIRKIISDDEPESPDADILNAALDGYSGAAARAPESYMGDLTRALASDPAPRPADDDIFDEAPPAPGYARRMSEALAEAIQAPQMAPAPVFVPEPVDDDADLFEAGTGPAEEPEEAEPIEALEIAIETAREDEEEVVAELDDPISLGPEIELVDEVVEAVDASDLEQAAPAETGAAPSAVAAMPVASPAVSKALAPPPPPPPPVSVEAGPAIDELPPVEAAALVEAQAPIDPVPPAEAMAPADLPVSKIAIASEPPAVAETMDVAPLVSDEVQSVEAAPASLPEITDPTLASTGADEPPAMVETPVEPVASAEASPVADPGAPAIKDPPPAAGAPAVSEDVMAQLLKPMLKEWLDANMPRIVAKAMGEGGKPDADTPQAG